MVTLQDLEQIALFSELSSAALHRVLAVASSRSYDDGQVILLEGDRNAPVFFVLHGAVRVFRTSLEGREQNLIHLQAGDALNMPAAFAEADGAPASAMARGHVELISIARPGFRSITSQTPEIALAVLRDLSEKLYHLTELSRDLGLHTVRSRLARFLLAHARSEDGAPIRWTHQEIAAQIGTVREVVGRTLRSFVEDGLVEMQRHRIVVRDAQALARETEA
jgi:CRP/FNR family cyclic AMP-dependent transcriptional regulator